MSTNIIMRNPPINYGISMNSYSYGDGSKNMINNGYNPNEVWVNDTNLMSLRPDLPQYWSCGNINNYAIQDIGGYYATESVMLNGQYNSTMTRQPIYGNTTLNFAAQQGGFGTFAIQIHGGAYSGYVTVSNLLIMVNGTYYNLSQLVSNGLIQPMVLIASASNGPYAFNNAFNIYNNSQALSGTYPILGIMFVPKSNAFITSVKFDATRFHYGTYNDGLFVIYYKGCFYHL